MKDVLFKIVLFGDAGVGKTSLVKRYLTGLFDPQYRITVGVDFHVKLLELDGKKISLQIWDFAGESQFKFLLPAYIRGASGGVCMYDITRKSSLVNIDDWLSIINRSIQQEADRFPILLVGGKSDLIHRREVSLDDASESLKKYDFLDSFECSSMMGKNVEKIFVDLTRVMMERANLL